MESQQPSDPRQEKNDVAVGVEQLKSTGTQSHFQPLMPYGLAIDLKGIRQLSGQNLLTSSTPMFFDAYDARQSGRLGIALSVIGLLSVIFQAVSSGLNNYDYVKVGHGFWCGIVFTITGLVGIWAKGKIRRIVTAFCAFCVLSTALAIVLFALSVATAASDCCYYYDGVTAMQSLLAVSAVAAAGVSIRGVMISRCAIPTLLSNDKPAQLDYNRMQTKLVVRDSIMAWFVANQIPVLLPFYGNQQSPLICGQYQPQQSQDPQSIPTTSVASTPAQPGMTVPAAVCQFPTTMTQQQLWNPSNIQSLQSGMQSHGQVIAFMLVPVPLSYGVLQQNVPIPQSPPPYATTAAV